MYKLHISSEHYLDSILSNDSLEMLSNISNSKLCLAFNIKLTQSSLSLQEGCQFKLVTIDLSKVKLMQSCIKNLY